MKLIVITEEELFAGEAEALNFLFEEGLELLHLRKPYATQEEVAGLLSRVKEGFHNRIVLHDHFCLTKLFSLKGIHLNERNEYIPFNFDGTKSRSCHTLEELTGYPDLDYLFLSPVFDSISKNGYHAAFSEQTLLCAFGKGIINHRTIALGGIVPENVTRVKQWGFGGIAVLGFLWDSYPSDRDENRLKFRFNQLKNVL